jgi:hypothetical protein
MSCRASRRGALFDRCRHRHPLRDDVPNGAERFTWDCEELNRTIEDAIVLWSARDYSTGSIADQ